MQEARVLIVDDEKPIGDFCAEALKRIPNLSVTTEHRSTRALRQLETGAFDLVITDLNMPEADGFDILRATRATDPEIPVIVMTGYPTIDTSVECLRLGASDYVLKPLILDDLLSTVSRVLDQRRLAQENTLLRRQLQRSSASNEILGRSEVVQNVRNAIHNLGDTDVDVLVSGPSGTGKELVARNIHSSSARASAVFVPVDCGAIPPDLFESEFFGHERGAFTGANERSIGLMEYADGGTLFLDEIGELSMPQQAKLLRALQERRFRRVGGREEISVDIRLVAATNRDLKEEVRAKRFREDLYFRINVGEIRLPPLKQRQGDIKLLLDHYLELFGPEMNRPGRTFKPEVLEALVSYSWPGNVRELINVVKRMLAMSKRRLLSMEDLPVDIRHQVETASPEAKLGGFIGERARMLEEFEHRYLEAVLRTCNGDVSAAARMAEISRQSIYRMMERLGLDANEFRDAANG